MCVCVYIYMLATGQQPFFTLNIQIFSTTNLRSHYACIFVLLSSLIPFLCVVAGSGITMRLGEGVKNGEACTGYGFGEWARSEG